MNLLLLLSALLSALTGVGGMARAPQVAQAQAVAAEGAAIVTPRIAQATVRPVQPLPSITLVAQVAPTTLPPVAGEPLWASRRRE